MKRDSTPHAAGTQALGQSCPHQDAGAQAAGTAPYVDDLRELKGTLFAAPILSGVAHGRLLGLDASAALALPGVHGLVLPSDIPGNALLDCAARDETVFAQHTVQHAGQVLGLVVAGSATLARHAARLVRPDIAPLPAILTLRQALALRSWVLPPAQLARGDAAAALARAPHRLRGRFETGAQEHFYLEGQIACALPLEPGQWWIQCSTQQPGQVQRWVARALGTPQHAVHVECRRLGGSFGGKETQAGHVAVWAALAAHKFGAPVKLRLDRQDDFAITGKRHPFTCDYDVGFDASGRIQGLRLSMAVNCGHSADVSGAVADRALLHCANAYFLEHVQLHSYRCRTHLPSHTAFRGLGAPQGVLAIEAILGDIARHLGRDALEVRRRNLYGSRGRRDTTPQGLRVPPGPLPDMLSKLELEARYAYRRKAISAWNATQPVLKRGLALTPVKFGIGPAAPSSQAGALVRVHADGSVQVRHGGAEMGQGLHTRIGQQVADILGVPLARVSVAAGDAGQAALHATGRGRGSDLHGRAAQQAARVVRARLVRCIAALDGCGTHAVTLHGGLVMTARAARGWDEAVALAHAAGVALHGEGLGRAPAADAPGADAPAAEFAHGVACAEVVIDTSTGESRVLAVDLLHDAGRSINPALDIGQIEGGFVQGMGWLTSEQLVWDGDGVLATDSPASYKIPATGDLPPHWRVRLWQGPRASSASSSKAVGEPPLLLAISVYEALRDAIAAARAPHAGQAPVQLDAPATAENLLRALGRLPD